MADAMTSIFRSGNPAISERVFDSAEVEKGMETMTLEGTMDKIGLLILLVLAGGAFSWASFTNVALLVAAVPIFIGACIVACLTGIILYFAPSWSPFLAPLFAMSEGVLLGATSHWTELFFHGIVIQAIGLTLGVVLTLFVCYRTGIIKVNQTFIMVVVGATAAIFLVYLMDFILSLFFHIQIPLINGSGPVGIGFSAVVVIVASLNLVIDFEFISQNCLEKAPKYMEWYGAYALLVTLIWVYIEILRLLTKLNRFSGSQK